MFWDFMYCRWNLSVHSANRVSSPSFTMSVPLRTMMCTICRLEQRALIHWTAQLTLKLCSIPNTGTSASCSDRWDFEETLECTHMENNIHVLNHSLTTFSVEQSPWEAKHSSASWSILSILWKLGVYYHVHNLSWLVSILSLVHVFPSYFFKVHYSLPFDICVFQVVSVLQVSATKPLMHFPLFIS